MSDLAKKRSEKLALKAMEYVNQQLEPNESVRVAVPAYLRTILGGRSSKKMYYLGLLQDNLMIVETDFLGKPAAVQRIELTKIESVKFSPKMLLDRLTLKILGEKPLKLEITRLLRTHSQKLASLLEGSSGY